MILIILTTGDSYTGNTFLLPRNSLLGLYSELDATGDKSYYARINFEWRKGDVNVLRLNFGRNWSYINMSFLGLI